jgi:biopolymer transport protein ExbB/TolQ
MSKASLEKFINEELKSPWPNIAYYALGAIALGVALLALLKPLLGFGIRLPLDWEIYLFNVLQNTGPVFSWLLATVFALGMALVVERLAFYVCYFFFSTRIRQCSENTYAKVSQEEAGLDGGQDNSQRNYTIQFLRTYLEFGGKEVAVTQDDVRIQAKHRARDLALNNINLKFGLKIIETCALLGPTLGFMGTLCGLVAAFGELAYGAELSSVLSGLSLSMTTSLLGAGIYVVFLAAGYLVELSAEAIESRCDRALRHYFDQLH